MFTVWEIFNIWDVSWVDSTLHFHWRTDIQVWCWKGSWSIPTFARSGQSKHLVSSVEVLLSKLLFHFWFSPRSSSYWRYLSNDIRWHKLSNRKSLSVYDFLWFVCGSSLLASIHSLLLCSQTASQFVFCMRPTFAPIQNDRYFMIIIIIRLMGLCIFHHSS